MHVVYFAADVSHVPSGAVGEDVDDDDVPGMELDSWVALIFPFGWWLYLLIEQFSAWQKNWLADKWKFGFINWV